MRDRPRKFGSAPPVLLLSTLVVLLASSCASLKGSSPIMPMKEYERILAGSLDADFVGNDTCLRACHVHDAVSEKLRQSVHGHQTDTGTGMPLVNCETCHGPGSLAIDPAFVQKFSRCDTGRFIQIKAIPPAARSMICLKCHSSHSMTSMQFWPGSQHALAEVSCTDCHKLHRSPRQKLEGKEINDLCFSCHKEIRARYALFSRHPLVEGRMSCVTCHEPHGSINERGLKGIDMRALCGRCHGEKAGPFRYEHGDINEDCVACHESHGSAFTGMLRYQEPFLCLQCHPGHGDPAGGGSPSKALQRALYTRCTDCHSQIHGSDTPGAHLRGGLVE